MRVFRGILYLMVGLIVTAVAVTAVVVTTPLGLRLALQAADPYLPAALDLGEVQGTLAGGVVVRDGAWRDERVTVEVDELEVNLDPWPLIRRRIRLERLHATGVLVRIAKGSAEAPAEEGGPFRFRMPVPLAIEDGRLDDVEVRAPGWSRSATRIELTAAMRGSRLQAERLVLASDWLDLDARGDAQFEPPYPLRLEADWRYGEAGDGVALAGSGSLDGDADAWALTHRLTAPREVTTEGTVQLREAGFHARLRNDIGGLQWQLDDGRTLSVTRGRVALAGWLDGFSAEGEARLTMDGFPAVRAEAAGRVSLETIALDRLRLESEAGTLQADGSLDLLPSPEWDMTYRLDGLNTSRWGAPVEATFSADGQTAGRWSAESGLAGTLVVDELAGDYQGETLAGSGTLELDSGGETAAREVEIAVGDNRLAVDGRLAPRPDVSLTVQAPRLGRLWPGLEGDLRGEVELSGSLEVPVISGFLETGGFRRDGMTLGAASLEARADDPGSRIVVTAERLEFGETLLEPVRATVAGTPAAHEVTLALTAVPGSAELSLSGGFSDPLGDGVSEAQWQGRLESARLTPADFGVWRLDAPAGLALAPGRAELERACLTAADGSSLCLAARTDAEASRVTAELGRLPMALLAPLFPAGSRFEGQAAGAADLAWREGFLDGEANLSVETARIGVMLDEDEQADLDIRSFTARASIERNAARLEAELDLGDQGDGEARLESADVFDTAAALDGMIRLDLRDLSMVPLLVPEVTQVRGSIIGRIDVSGSRREPRLGGALRLRDAGFLFPDTGIEITELEVVARQESPGMVDYEGSARSGDGTVRIRGSTRRGEDEGWVSRFTVRGENFLVVRLPDMQAAASPDLDILIDDRRLQIRGTIEVPEADVTLRDIGLDAVRASPDTVVHGRTEAGEARLGPVLVVEVEVVLGDAVHLEGFGLQTDLSGSLRLTGGSERPWLGFGRLSLVDASYKAYGQELMVERGELAFSGPLTNPTLDIRAVRDTGDVVAGVRIGGTVRSPSSTVFSEPPLPDAEALSYLLTGRPLSGTTTAEGNLLSRAALSLGISRAGAVASQVSQQVGLDTLAVEGGADDGRVLAGKRLGEDLYLEYAWGIFDRIGTLMVSYDLSDRLRLESRSGEQHSVDLVYRVKTD